MPGSGKSTIGKALASELDYTFIDLDTNIEANEGATIQAIFELKGEAYFRQIEAQELTRISEKKGDYIIASGGGTPCFYSGLSLMQKTGKVVFINVGAEVLISRLKSDTQRPLLNEGVEKRIQELNKKRIGIYSKAGIIINADQLSKKEAINLIKKEITI